MKISLVKKLSLSFILAVLGSIILASFISNYTVQKKFNEYLVDEHKTKVDNVVKIINDLYEQEKDLSKIKTDEIQRYAELQQFYVEIKDESDNTVYTSGKEYLEHKNMMGMMGSMMHNSSGSGINMGEYSEEQYPLIIDNATSGTIIVGYFGTSYLSSASMSFIATLNHSFIVSAIVALIFGVVISIIISRQISRPLGRITEIANKMRAGDLRERVMIKSKTKEIVELSNSINYLAETLNNQEKLRKRLTSDMAHELRTPLTTLKTHIEAFMDGIWEPTKDRFEIFYSEIERLSKMVDNLRDLAKLEQTNVLLNKSKVNLSNELEKIIDTHRPLFIKEDYRLDSNISPEIITVIDIDKFKQIMNNLLSNSYKHLSENGKVTVVLKQENRKNIIKIIDNGVGIPEKDIPYVFERFYRSDLSRNKNTGGSGIGLTIAKAFVEAHGGNIYLESKINKGTTFVVELPK